jgi:hypothetical protein
MKYKGCAFTGFFGSIPTLYKGLGFFFDIVNRSISYFGQFNSPILKSLTISKEITAS